MDRATLTCHDIQTISQPHWKYCSWPTLIKRRNGQLVAVYSGGRNHHVCPFGQIHLIHSNDDGLTWSEPRVLVDGPLDDRGAGIVETAKGTLLVIFFTTSKWESEMDGYDQGKPTAVSSHELSQWRTIRSQLSDEIRHRYIGCWSVRSEDDGVNWSKPVQTPVLSAHGPAAVSDGSLIYAGKVAADGIGMDMTPFTEAYDFGVARSVDDGKTWDMTTRLDPPLGHKYTEPAVVEAADGRLVMHIRHEVVLTTEQRKDHAQIAAAQARRTIHQSQSFDLGRTWEAPRDTGIYGFPCHLLRLSDQRLLTTYGHRLDPISVQLRLSHDHGQSWSDAYMLYQNPQSTTDMGYPSTVELNDGCMLTLWYERLKQHSVAVIKTARWQVDQL